MCGMETMSHRRRSNGNKTVSATSAESQDVLSTGSSSSISAGRSTSRCDLKEVCDLSEGVLGVDLSWCLALALGEGLGMGLDKRSTTPLV